jgi:hypothetical protein
VSSLPIARKNSSSLLFTVTYSRRGPLARFLLFTGQEQHKPREPIMSRQIRHNSLIIGAASTLIAATTYGAEPTGEIGHAALQAALAPLPVDTRAQAADVGRVVAGRALAVTHRITLQPQLKLAEASNPGPERS